MKRTCLLLLCVGLVAQGCTIVTELPGKLVRVEGKNLVGHKALGKPRIVLGALDSVLKTGQLEVTLLQKSLPLYKADKVYFEKIQIVEHVSPFGATVFVLLVAATSIIVIAMVVLAADSFDGASSSSKEAAKVMAEIMTHEAIHAAELYSREQTWVHNLWYYDPLAEVIPDEFIVLENLNMAGAESEAFHRPITAETVELQVLKDGENMAALSAETNGEGRAYFNLIPIAREAGGAALRLRVSYGAGTLSELELSSEDVRMLAEKQR